MKCEKCIANIPLDAKFCPNCGEKVQMFNEEIKGNEIKLEWLIELFKKIGFEVDVNSNGDSFLGEHKDSYNFDVNLNISLKIITISSHFPMKQRNISDVNKLQDAVAKANSLSILGIFSLSDNNKLLKITTHINLTELLIERDIVVYLDIFEKNVIQLMENLEIMDI